MQRVFLILLFTISAGCEPMPGDLVDERELKVGAAAVKLQLRSEGTFGNPANGQHLSLHCFSEGRWIKVARGYWVLGNLQQAPISRVVMDRSGFLFTDVMGGAVFSFDFCRTVHFWNGEGLPFSGSSILELVDEVLYCRDGPALAFRIHPQAKSPAGPLWFITNDAGKHWTVLHDIPSALPCDATAVERVQIPVLNPAIRTGRRA